MKTICGWIGWIIGMFLGFSVCNSVPFLGFLFIIGGIPLGRYIGGQIEESREQERRRQEEYARQKQQEEYAIQRLAQQRSEAQALARKYPEATKHYFKQHWGIVKSHIFDYDITDDKIETLLSHKWSYERDEQTFNEQYKAKIEAERQEQLRREAQRREVERQALLAKQRAEEQAKRSLPEKVSNWNVLYGTLHYNYLLNYYPTTCDFEATQDEWDDRWTVWNFKNTPGKTSETAHSAVLDKIIPQIKYKLINTFGKDSLHHLTLVCIPASSTTKTERRYKEFSSRICNETGMINAYDKIQVIFSSDEKKFGGSGILTDNVSFDSNFFRGKYVLLFDDIITKGESMLRFKRKMEELGAIVVGGLSIGKTKHERY